MGSHSSFRICDDSKTRETINISYLASAVLFIGAAAFLLHWYRDVPDPIGIRRESAITWTASAIIGVIALVFHLVDLGGFRQEEPVSFGWVGAKIIFVHWNSENLCFVI